MDRRRLFSLSLLVLGLALPAAVVAQTPKTLTVTNAGGGTVVSSPSGINCGVDCTETYAHGTDVTLTATADPGQIFTGWSGDCTGTGTCAVKMNQNRAVTATFQVAFTLSVDKAGPGSGTVTSSPAGIDCGVDCGEPYATGTVVTLTATPATGSTFTGWSGDCTGTGMCVVTMSQARSVTATFSIATYELTVSLAGAGTGTVTSSPAGINCGVDCSEVYDYNTLVALTATPATGSVFDGWSGACAGTGACNVTMDQARSVTATFSVASFELTVSLAGAGSGTVTSSPAGIDCGSDCSESYPYNTVVALTATPATGSVFDGWSGACTGTDPCNVTTDQARSVTATFSVASFELTVNLSGAGSGAVTSSPAGIDCGSDCSESYSYNTVVTLTAAPDVGSVFDGWSGDCTGTDPCNVTMDQARSVTATFAVATFELTVDLAGPGSGSVSSSPSGIDCGSDCSETYEYNTEVTLTATPDTGSVLGAWGGDCTGTGECVVTLDQARSVTATFEVGSFVLSVAKDGTGGGTVTSSPAGIDCGSDCSESYSFNTQVTLTATADVESGFIGWSGACTGTDPCIVTMSQSRSVTATFNTLAGNNFYTLTPCRVIDTRLGTPMSSGVSILVNVAGTCGVPATAKAVAVNLTAISPPGAGFMVLYPGDGAVPTTATITFPALTTRTNNAIIALDSNGDGTLGAQAVFAGGGTMNMAIDVSGYFDE